MFTVLYESPIDWPFLFQRPQQLMRAFARMGCRAIFYLNPDVASKLAPGIFTLEPNLFVVIHQDPRPLCVPPLVVWLTYPPYVQSVARWQPAITLFDIIDDSTEEFSDWAPDVESAFAAADMVFAVSKELLRSARERHGRTYLLPNAADYDHFARAALPGPVPDELAGIPQPIVGFYGAIAPWVKLDWIEAAAESHPEWSFVLIGPRLFQQSALPGRPNIHLFGHRDYLVLPQYLRAFRVAVLPFRLSPMILASDPIKLYEYCAAGKPVVASALPRAAEMPGTRTASTAAEFVAGLEAATAEDSAAQVRIAFARENTWSHRVGTAVGLIRQILDRKKL